MREEDQRYGKHLGFIPIQTERRKRPWLKATAWIAVVTFCATQAAWSQEFEILQQNPAAPSYTPVIKEDHKRPEPVFPTRPPEDTLENSTDFLAGTLTLTPAGEGMEEEAREPEAYPGTLERDFSPETPESYDYEYERYDFKDALDLLRPEYASAVIVKNLKAEDLKELVNLSFETGILVLGGEIVLFTSGSEDEIGVLPAVKALAEKATFISHTHPSIHSKEGPSGQDINEAVEASGQEYVITHQGVYAYTHRGILNNGEPFSYEWYLERILETVAASKEEQNQIGARAALNQFITGQDRYNQALEEERKTFRRGGTLSYTPGLTASNVTTLPGSPYPYFTPGSAQATTLSHNATTNQFLLGYSVPGTNDFSGLTISFDNASTPIVETRSITSFTNLFFGLKGPNPSAKLEFVDINGRKDTFTLTNISNSTERFWKVPVSSISNTLDKTRIKCINFIVTQTNTTSTIRTGVLYIRTKGLNTSVPTQPIVTSSIPLVTNKTTLTISGTKEANTAILVNGVQVVARDSSTTWSATVNLATEGNNTLNITTKNSIGKGSSAKMLTLKRDTVLPTGSININSGALYAASQTVILNLSGTDTGSGMDRMSFSTDNVNWTTSETYATSKSFNLPAGDGNKTVYVKYYDKAGNLSTLYSKSIILDTLPPIGTVKVNNGAQYVTQTAVTLNLSATDAGSGLSMMSFSSNNSTWTTAEAYAATKSWTFSAGDGNKTVYVKFQDKSGKWSSPVSVTVLLDTVAPTGTVKINNDAVYATSRSVTLNLTQTDATSGANRMRFKVGVSGTWSAWEAVAGTKTLDLADADGSKTVYYQVEDKAGLISADVTDSIILDRAAPTGTVKINNDAVYATNRSVTLNLTQTDATSGANRMRFKVGSGGAWSAWEAVANVKTLDLADADGTQTVYYQVEDKAGLISADLTDSIILDRAAPAGSILINDGAAETVSREVALKLTAADTHSGIAGMRFSYNLGETWTGWESFAPVKQVQLEGGEGVKNIRYQIIDNAGNVSAYDAQIKFLPPATVEFLSPPTTDSSLYTLIYTVAGREIRESWQLNLGKNHLLIRVPLGGDSFSFAEFEVTCTKAEDPAPAMPEIPALPEDLIATTTEGGLVFKYSGGNLVLVEKPGDYKMYLPELDAGQNLTGGLLVYQSGDRLLYRNSSPLLRIARDGEKHLYSADGNVSSVVSAAGKKVRFAYQKDAQGKMLAVLSLEDSVASLYDAQGLPAWIRMTDGTDVRYSGGKLERYTDATGNVFSYQISETRSGENLTGYSSRLAFVTPAGSAARIPLSDILANIGNYPDIEATIEEKLSLGIEYDANGKMLQFSSGKGEVLKIENRLPVSLKDSLGNVTSIQSRLDDDGNIVSLDWNEGAYQQTFDSDGNLSGLRIGDGTVLNIKSLKVDEMVLSDGSVLSDLTWNGNSLTGFVRARPDGSEETYQDSRIIKRKDANGTVTTFVSIDGVGHMDKIKTKDGKTYQVIEYQNAQGLMERMTELVRMDMEDGSRIEFEHGKPVRYIQKKKVQQDATEVPRLPEGESYVPSVRLANAELRSVTIDADANILSGEILFKDGTQYLIKNGELYKQITASGKVVEFKDEPPRDYEKPRPVPAEPLTAREIAYRNELVEKQLDYFVSGVGIDADTGLPLDNYAGATGIQANYSQATLVGFWAEILSAIARGDYVTPKISRTQAFQKLSALILEYRKVQQQAGWKGMVSFFTINKSNEPVLDETGKPTGQTRLVISYERAFENVGLGDNLNLSVSLSSVIGALKDITLDEGTAAVRDQIIAKANEILNAQDEGYPWFYDYGPNRLRSYIRVYPWGWAYDDSHMDRVFNEFRPGLIWLAARNSMFENAVKNLDVAVRSYETADGARIDNAVPFDGGAFQMFWPLLHVDETKYSEFDAALRNFLYAQADYAERNDIPGLLSAGDDPGQGYNGKMGLPAVAETDDPLATNVGSIYGTASAFALAPHYTLQTLKNIETKYPQVKTVAGWVDAVKMKEVTTVDPVTGKTITTKQPVFSNQYFGVDQAGFILSLLNKSQGYFSNYLAQQNIDRNYDALYREMQFGLTPVAKKNPPSPDLGQSVVPLYDGMSSAPDGIGSGLGKRPAFISALSDPELGEGRVFDYVNADETYHHSEIEFSKACATGACGGASEKRIMNLQEYLLLHGRAEMAKTLFEGFSLDVLNEAQSQGAFYTADNGYANAAFATDAKMGEIRRLSFDLREVSKPVGIWAKYDTFDLNSFDYISVPVRLGPNTPAGTGLKFELKGLGEIYVTGPLTGDWQYFQIPVVKPAGNLGEIAVVVQSADGKAAKGEVQLGPMSAFKVRNSKKIDWGAALGMNDYQVRNLLKEKAQRRASGGEVIDTEEILENFTLDSTGKLVNGVLKRADGGVQYFSEGKLRKWVFKNGRTVTFENGLAAFVLDLARGTLQEGRFYYDQSLNGAIRSFVLQDNDRKRIFGSDGSLKTIIENGYTANLKDGKIDTLVTDRATLSGIEWLEDRSILRAHVKTSDGREFDIGRDVEQTIDAGDGVKVYYKGLQIIAIETPQNGRTDFTYSFNAEGKIVGVDAAFDEKLTDPVTELESTGRRTMSLLDYIKRPERTREMKEILREAPVNVLPSSSVGGFTVGWGNDAAVVGQNGFPARLAYWYRNATGPEFGLYAIHNNLTMDLSNFDFLVTTLNQGAQMDWQQPLNLKLKTYGHGTLYNFAIDNLTSTPQTYWFPLAGKQGTEVEVTVEPQRVPEGVNKSGSVFIDGINYVAVKKLDKPLWEAEVGMTVADARSIKTESENLVSVGREIATGKPLRYDRLVPLLDLPTRMIYSDLSAAVTGELVNFRRFDGSVVELNGKTVTQVILPDGTVNDYSGTGNAGAGVIHGPDSGEGGANLTDYRYGALRKITQSDGHELDFSYEFDESGAEITVIKDLVSKDERRFKDGKLLRSDSADKTETRYRYADGELAAAEFTYKNKVIESTRYRFANDETQVTDDRGTTWFYDANGNLTRHLTKDGYLFRYADHTMTLPAGTTPDPGDYKSKIYGKSGLKAVHLAGYEANDGSSFCTTRRIRAKARSNLSKEITRSISRWIPPGESNRAKSSSKTA